MNRLNTHSRKQRNDKWITPPELKASLHKEFVFDEFDPCPIEWKEGDEDGLKMEWSKTTFVNPPFSQIGLWLKKANEEWKKGKTVVLLMNAKTDIEGFHEYVLKYPTEIRFIKGRINFVHPQGLKSTNPYPTLIVIFRKENL